MTYDAVQVSRKPNRHHDAILNEHTALLHSTESAKHVDSTKSLRHNPQTIGLLGSVASSLENTGSVARDHLALERTFLAYMRTSLAIASSGVALVQLFAVSSGTSQGLQVMPPIMHASIRPIGSVMVVFGLLILGLGTARYFKVQGALVTGKFPVAQLSLGAMSTVLSLLVIVIFAVLASGALDSGEH